LPWKNAASALHSTSALESASETALPSFLILSIIQSNATHAGVYKGPRAVVKDDHVCGGALLGRFKVSRDDHCLYDLLLRHKAGELNGDVVLIVSNHLLFD
jgi:hypothetical protein